MFSLKMKNEEQQENNTPCSPVDLQCVYRKEKKKKNTTIHEAQTHGHQLNILRAKNDNRSERRLEKKIMQ